MQNRAKAKVLLIILDRYYFPRFTFYVDRKIKEMETVPLQVRFLEFDELYDIVASSPGLLPSFIFKFVFLSYGYFFLSVKVRFKVAFPLFLAKILFSMSMSFKAEK